MSSIKCSNCGFVNFEDYQSCKRCNISLSQDLTNNERNETRIVKSPETHIRPQVKPLNIPPIESFPPPMPRRMPFPPKQNNALPEYNQPYRQKKAMNEEKPPSNDWSLPRFPKDQRPREFQTRFQPPQPKYYQQNQAHYHQPPHHQYYVPVTAFRRFGDEIILNKNCNLPFFCVKCESFVSHPHEIVYAPQSYRWHHPLVYVALISPLIYLILSLALTHRVSANIPICVAHNKQRQSIRDKLIVAGLILFLLTVFGCFFGWYLPALLVFFIYLIVAALIMEYDYKPLRVTKVEGDFIHLKGATNAYLDQIPY
jgi:hypothetical protein